MKWILPSVQVILLYLLATVFFIDLNFHTGHYLIILGVLLFISGAINIAYAVKCAIKPSNKSKEREKLRAAMLFFKLLTVPFFIANFIVFAIAAFLPLIFVFWIFYPLVVIATYFLMLVTSSYSIAVLVLYNKSKLLSKRAFAVHVILQLVFIADVVDAIYLFFALRKKDLGADGIHTVFAE